MHYLKPFVGIHVDAEPDILHQATGSRGYTGKTRLRGLKTLILH
ncbi:hypothetical protein [Nostoc sp.]